MDAATAQARLAACLAAYDDALGAASESRGDHQLVHHKLETLRGEIAYWQRQIDAYTAVAAGSGVTGVLTPKWT